MIAVEHPFLTSYVCSSTLARVTPPIQRSLDDLGTPLAQVEFCVLDIETTGTSRDTDAITELAAARFRGGVCTGTFQTLINPGTRIPPAITVLTGITESMIAGAPPIGEVLPSFIEFVGRSVVVGHNVGFDLGFINAALERTERPPLGGTVVDTLALARRLVRDEVPDCRLGTLASRLRLDHRPSHRALDDVLATADLLHLLLERAGRLGVLGLDDLVDLPRLGRHPQADKLRLTTSLPRTCGVYRFRDARGEVLYVGKATNLRQRVRSYFGGDERRKVAALLRETSSIDVVTTPDVLVAEVLEARALRTLQPRYNRAGTTCDKYRYVRLTLDEPWPRLTIATEPSDTGVHLGPLPSRRMATLVIEAIHSVVPVRRCSGRLARHPRPSLDRGPCTSHQLGVATCACSGLADPDAYSQMIDRLVTTLREHPEHIVDRLWERMAELAAAQRFEEAASVRDRAHAFAAAITRRRYVERFREAGRMSVRVGGTHIDLDRGVVIGHRRDGELTMALDADAPDPTPVGGAVSRACIDEILCVARSFERRRNDVEVLRVSGRWSWDDAPLRLPRHLYASAQRP